MTRSIRSRFAIMILCATLVVTVCFGVATVPSYAKDNSNITYSQIKEGRSYELDEASFIYKGPDKDYGIVNRASLNPSTKKHAVSGITKAKLKKGTVVTCLDKRNKWIKIPSGWIRYTSDTFTRA